MVIICHYSSLRLLIEIVSCYIVSIMLYTANSTIKYHGPLPTFDVKTMVFVHTMMKFLLPVPSNTIFWGGHRGHRHGKPHISIV